MSQIPSVFARSARRIADAVAVRADPHLLLRTVGLDREAIDDSGLRIPYSDLMMLSEHAARMTKDGAFGIHVGERVKVQSYGIVGYSIVTSSTVEDALRSQARYLPIWTNVGNFKLDVDRRAAHFQWEYSATSLPEPNHDCEQTMATVTQFLRDLTSAEWKLREVWFQHRKPRDTSEHVRIFRSPVHFGMPKNSLLFDSRFLRTPIKSANSYAHRVIAAVAEQLSACPPDTQPLSQAALSLIRQGMGSGDFTLDDISQRLNLSRRTLQRRLRQESSSHRKLLQQARRDVSRFLLSSTGATTVEVAYALGFSEPTVFYHTFQEWFGVSPQAYRRSIQLH